MAIFFVILTIHRGNVWFTDVQAAIRSELKPVILQERLVVSLVRSVEASAEPLAVYPGLKLA